jgi:2,3-bisphosphoglycerate-independent phosphoglycerate mutase
MDRDHRWERTHKAWQAIVHGTGNTAANARVAIEQAYLAGQTDEFIEPTVLHSELRIQSDDVVLFFNFRKDRARQMTAALFKQDFNEFDRGEFQSAHVTCMTEYDEWFSLPYAFCQDRPHTNLSEIVSAAGYRQFHCAETEKYAHVTYFFNGRKGDAYSGEERRIVPSPKVATYDLAPAMSAAGVANEVVKALETNQYSFIVVNFANGDMVGHTGVHEAVLRSVHALDREVGRVLDAAVTNGYSVVLTSDHGNCEETVDYQTGAPHTQHTVFPVPCLIIDKKFWPLAIGAGLSSVAPTVLQLMGLEIPSSMTGRSLLLK